MPNNTLSMIAAMGSNRVIGLRNGLPWVLPDDHEWFRRITAGKPFIMGRKSYISPDAFLSRHSNFILTRQAELELCENCHRITQLDDAISRAQQASVEEIFVIGGASVYAQALPKCDKLYLTMVEAAPEGDAFFPEFDTRFWQQSYQEFHSADERHAYAFTFRVFERIKR
jgi:dihydrofolate reductase